MQRQLLDRPVVDGPAEGTLRVEFIEAASWSNEDREGVEMRFRISLPGAAFRSINQVARFGLHIGGSDGWFSPGTSGESEDVEYRCPEPGCPTKEMVGFVKVSDPPYCRKHNKLLVEQPPPPG